MARELIERHRVDLVEVVEDACLVPAQQPQRPGIAYVPGVAGEVDSRVEIEDPACRCRDLSLRHRVALQRRIFVLSNQFIFL
jgi:hypothetical protein